VPATRGNYSDVGRRERIPALIAAAVIQAAFMLALLIGLRVPVGRAGGAVTRLIEVVLPKLPTPVPKKPARPVPAHARSPRPKPSRASPGSAPALPAPVAPRVVFAPAPVSAGGAGAGASVGSGSGSGDGGEGGDGGTDLVQIAGAILPSDYPRDLRERRIGGRVGVLFTVGANGRVTACSVTRASGVPELDILTCRLIRERFVYRPSTDRFGHPIADEVEGEHDWTAGGR
jgi:protein TonB